MLPDKNQLLFRGPCAIWIAAAMGLVGCAEMRAADIAFPAETARYIDAPLPGYPLAAALCSTCHSADYARSQPPSLTRSYWNATVVKMQKTFGAPIPPDSVNAIVDYLAKTYGSERGSPPASLGKRPGSR